MGEFLEQGLSSNGMYYNKRRFLNQRPGDQYKYSNIDAALAAYIIGLTTAMPFDVYIENEIMKPLGIEKGVWKHSLTDNPLAYYGWA